MTSIDNRSLPAFSIQLAVDGSENSEQAAHLIRSLTLPRGSLVTVVGVLGKDQPDGHEPTLKGILEKIERGIAGEGIPTAARLLCGHTAKALIDFANELEPDLIVVGATGLHATLKILLGGIAQQVVEYARWPVLVVRSPIQKIHQMLLAVDGSPYSRLSAEYLTQFPLPAETEVTVIHVLPSPPDLSNMPLEYGFGRRYIPAMAAQAELEQVDQRKLLEEKDGQRLINDIRRILEKGGLKTKGELVRGDPAKEILEHARIQKIDLIVAGSRGLSAIQGWWWGSVSRKLVHYAGCSVLFVRGRPEKRTQ